MSLSLGGQTGLAKSIEVTKLLSELTESLQTSRLSAQECEARLVELKVYGRDPTGADPIYTKNGISTIADYAFNNSTRSVSRAALGCLANALLLTPRTRQSFVDLDYQTKACGLLKCGHADDEFLVSRVLFLTTYETNIDLVKLLTHDGLAGIICQILERHVKIRAQSTLAKKAPSMMEDMALTEVLKLQFNVMHYCPQEAKDFSPSIPSIIALFNIEPPLATNTINALVNALINLDLEREEQYHDAIFDSSSKDNFNTRLIRVLRTTLSQSAQENLDAQVAPLLTLVHKLYIIAPTETKDIYKLQLLPDKEDRKEILGQSQSLPSLLLNLTTAPLAPQARELASDLLFELSDKDATKFVDNIGYGFASAYLFQHKIALPENALNAAASSTDHPINPITGQRLDMETAFSGPEMTQEEKEREAERLMVLFDRMKRSGIIDVENPVHKAQHEGRFEELKSDDESD